MTPEIKKVAPTTTTTSTTSTGSTATTGSSRQSYDEIAWFNNALGSVDPIVNGDHQQRAQTIGELLKTAISFFGNMASEARQEKQTATSQEGTLTSANNNLQTTIKTNNDAFKKQANDIMAGVNAQVKLLEEKFEVLRQNEQNVKEEQDKLKQSQDKLKELQGELEGAETDEDKKKILEEMKTHSGLITDINVGLTSAHANLLTVNDEAVTANADITKLQANTESFLSDSYTKLTLNNQNATNNLTLNSKELTFSFKNDAQAAAAATKIATSTVGTVLTFGATSSQAADAALAVKDFTTASVTRKAFVGINVPELTTSLKTLGTMGQFLNQSQSGIGSQIASFTGSFGSFASTIQPYLSGLGKFDFLTTFQNSLTAAVEEDLNAIEENGKGSEETEGTPVDQPCGADEQEKEKYKVQELNVDDLALEFA